jgi:hypothetical protein
VIEFLLCSDLFVLEEHLLHISLFRSMPCDNNAVADSFSPKVIDLGFDKSHFFCRSDARPTFQFMMFC